MPRPSPPTKMHQSTLHYRIRKLENQTIKCPHTDENGNPCPYETPYGKSNIAQHTQQHHTHIRPYGCEECGRTYNQKFNLDKHRFSVHEIPLPPTKATRHAERTSVKPIFDSRWVFAVTPNESFKHREIFERHQGIYDTKQTDFPKEIKSNMSRHKKSGKIDYGWKIFNNNSPLVNKKKHSKKNTRLIAKFMNQLNAIHMLHRKNAKPHIMDLLSDYPKSHFELSQAMEMFAWFLNNNRVY